MTEAAAVLALALAYAWQVREHGRERAAWQDERRRLVEKAAGITLVDRIPSLGPRVGDRDEQEWAMEQRRNEPWEPD